MISGAALRPCCTGHGPTGRSSGPGRLRTSPVGGEMAACTAGRHGSPSRPWASPPRPAVVRLSDVPGFAAATTRSWPGAVSRPSRMAARRAHALTRCGLGVERAPALAGGSTWSSRVPTSATPRAASITATEKAGSNHIMAHPTPPTRWRDLRCRPNGTFVLPASWSPDGLQVRRWSGASSPPGKVRSASSSTMHGGRDEMFGALEVPPAAPLRST